MLLQYLEFCSSNPLNQPVSIALFCDRGDRQTRGHGPAVTAGIVAVNYIIATLYYSLPYLMSTSGGSPLALPVATVPVNL